MTAPAIGAAFGAGLLSFLSPCILPLIPGYLSFISGFGLSDIRSGRGRGRLLAATAVFTAGFTAVFVALGLAFTGAQALLGGWSRILTLGAGIVIIALGLNFLFDFAKILDLEARFHPKAERRGSLASAFLLGLSFAAGWSPCVGPILASILLFASSEGGAGRSALLLGAYSLGLALPFFAAAAFFERLTPLLSWLKRRARTVRVVSGLFLVLLGTVMAVGRLGAVSSLAVRVGIGLQEALIRSPTALRVGGMALWAIAAAALLVLPAIRHRPAFTKPRLVLATFLFLAAAAEAAGFWSTARLASAWLLFSGG